MDASSYALAHGLRRTRGALAAIRRQPSAVLGRWLGASVLIAGLLLLAVWGLAEVRQAWAPPAPVTPQTPPFVRGGAGNIAPILHRNLLVLALHAMACVAGFIAGSSLPLQAAQHRGLTRWVHQRGQPVAMAFVLAATLFSLSSQVYVLGTGVAQVSEGLHVPPALLVVALLPHALPELVALFLPLAAWVLASRRQEWDGLLAATLVTVAVAVPVLVLAALWEVYVAPELLAALVG